MQGVEKSAAPARNLAAVEDFCSRLDLLAYGAKASLHDGQIRASLEHSGTPIGVNDLHIAARARSEGLTLISNNLREFKRVPGLLLENWASRHTVVVSLRPSPRDPMVARVQLSPPRHQPSPLDGATPQAPSRQTAV